MSGDGLVQLVFGCEQLGGHNWGEIDFKDLSSAVRNAVSLGVRFFDTADCYGKGVSEQRLGSLISPVRDKVVILSKFGVRFRSNNSVFFDCSPNWMQQALTDSLRRLKTDYIDVYQVHYDDGVTPLEEVFFGLEKLIEKGTILRYGVTNIDISERETSIWPGLMSFSHEYSLLERSIEKKIGLLTSRGLTFFSYGCLGQGFLSGKYKPGTSFGVNDRRGNLKYKNFHGDQLNRNMSILNVLEKWSIRLNVNPSQLAVAWILESIEGVRPIIGIKSNAQLLDMEKAFGMSVCSEAYAELNDVSNLENLEIAH